MSESSAIGIRLEDAFLKRIEELGKAEHLDRSTTMRILLEEGYKNHMKKKAAEKYMRGATTISGAAAEAGVTIWDMENYLVDAGFKSQYSVEDLKKEIALLG
jgi:ribose 5-phosphate isomerase